MFCEVNIMIKFVYIAIIVICIAIIASGITSTLPVFFAMRKFGKIPTALIGVVCAYSIASYFGKVPMLIEPGTLPISKLLFNLLWIPAAIRNNMPAMEYTGWWAIFGILFAFLAFALPLILYAAMVSYAEVIIAIAVIGAVIQKKRDVTNEPRRASKRVKASKAEKAEVQEPIVVSAEAFRENVASAEPVVPVRPNPAPVHEEKRGRVEPKETRRGREAFDFCDDDGEFASETTGSRVILR